MRIVDSKPVLFFMILDKYKYAGAIVSGIVGLHENVSEQQNQGTSWEG